MLTSGSEKASNNLVSCGAAGGAQNVRRHASHGVALLLTFAFGCFKLALRFFLGGFALTFSFFFCRFLRGFLLLGKFRLLRFQLGALPLEFCGGGVLFLLVQDFFVGAFAVDGGSVFFHERRLALEHCGFRLVRRGRHQALRWQDFRILDDRRPAVFVEEAHERLTCAQLQNGVFALEARVGSKRLRGRLNGFLLGRHICSQAMLHAV